MGHTGQRGVDVAVDGVGVGRVLDALAELAGAALGEGGVGGLGPRRQVLERRRVVLGRLAEPPQRVEVAVHDQQLALGAGAGRGEQRGGHVVHGVLGVAVPDQHAGGVVGGAGDPPLLGHAVLVGGVVGVAQALVEAVVVAPLGQVSSAGR